MADLIHGAELDRVISEVIDTPDDLWKEVCKDCLEPRVDLLLDYLLSVEKRAKDLSFVREAAGKVGKELSPEQVAEMNDRANAAATLYLGIHFGIVLEQNR